MWQTSGCDGSRADHSLAVAGLALAFCRQFSLSEHTTLHAVAWALVHDLATWPLSHTGEAAFSPLTETTSADLRKMMIKGDRRLPAYFQIKSQLEQAGIHIGVLDALFDKRKSDLDQGLRFFYDFIQSPITPDTLEGMRRTGRVININTPDPKRIILSLKSDLLNDIVVDAKKSDLIFKFWKSKGIIYSNFINRKDIIEFESNWSQSIRENFVGCSLSSTLLLDEKYILDKVWYVALNGSSSKIVRYKSPLRYEVDRGVRDMARLPAGTALSSLDKFLLKNRAF